MNRRKELLAEKARIEAELEKTESDIEAEFGTEIRAKIEQALRLIKEADELSQTAGKKNLFDFDWELAEQFDELKNEYGWSSSSLEC